MTQSLTPKQFVSKWSAIQQKETAVSQSHFNDIHRALDTAVLDAYNWPHNLTDEQILEHLLTLNLQRAAAQ